MSCAKKSFVVFLIIFLFSAFVVFVSRQAGVQVVTDDEYFSHAYDIIRAANHEIEIIMFEMRYYPTYNYSKTNLLLNEIKKASQRGVNVKIILEGGEDYLGVGFKDKQAQVCNFFQNSSVIVRYDPGNITTHAKLLIADNYVLLGSTNWVYYSLKKNHETNVLIKSRQISSKFGHYFDVLWNQSVLC
ncbi:MAG: hypothetical protein J7J92_03025 [Candidatus Aenigmarchaeota archaeon]|nr:hypothetical protein [Candidatus Aenigmarchaeota archaeon]